MALLAYDSPQYTATTGRQKRVPYSDYIEAMSPSAASAKKIREEQLLATQQLGLSERELGLNQQTLGLKAEELAQKEKDLALAGERFKLDQKTAEDMLAFNKSDANARAELTKEQMDENKKIAEQSDELRRQQLDAEKEQAGTAQIIQGAGTSIAMAYLADKFGWLDGLKSKPITNTPPTTTPPTTTPIPNQTPVNETVGINNETPTAPSEIQQANRTPAKEALSETVNQTATTEAAPVTTEAVPILAGGTTGAGATGASAGSAGAAGGGAAEGAVTEGASGAYAGLIAYAAMEVIKRGPAWLSSLMSGEDGTMPLEKSLATRLLLASPEERQQMLTPRMETEIGGPVFPLNPAELAQYKKEEAAKSKQGTDFLKEIMASSLYKDLEANPPRGYASWEDLGKQYQREEAAYVYM